MKKIILLIGLILLMFIVGGCYYTESEVEGCNHGCLEFECKNKTIVKECMFNNKYLCLTAAIPTELCRTYCYWDCKP